MAFLGSKAQPLPPLGHALVPRLGSRIYLRPSTPTHFHPHNQSWAGLPRCVPTSLYSSGTGMLTGCPSPTLYSLGLGPTNPTRIDLPSETLDLRRTRFSRVFRYSCLHSHFHPLQPPLPVDLHCWWNAPLPPQLTLRLMASVPRLSPVKFSAQGH